MTLTTAVVLAGGEGSRLQPLTANRPKPLLPVGGRPILEHVFDGLIANGIDEIHLVIGYHGDRVQDRFGPTYRGKQLEYHHQAKQLGSGHALLQARDALAEPFVVVNGDQLVDPDLVDDVIEAHRDAATIATIGVVRTEAASQYGAVELTNDGEVIDLVERPTDGDYELLNAGVYAFDPVFFDVLGQAPRVEGSLSLPTVVAAAAADSELTVTGVRTEGFWTDATYPWDLLEASQQLLEREWGRPAGEHSTEQTDCWIAEGARVHSTVTLRRPVVIDDEAVIGPGAVVGPNTVVGRNVTIGANTVVEGSVLDDDTRVGPNTTLSDCVTGQQAHIEAGVTAAGGPAAVHIQTTVHPDRRLGAVIADRAQIHSGATLCGGVLIGPNATVGDGVQVRTNIGEGEVIR
ncbi:sugar phosphate nucleotidyltransferase [Halorubrum amylolyticum]|uniref:sugar phosphate nucleotidyltransferase n=1 Tax=Halorubrum amylolyticum TaxID=2508724 RepID=UPI001008E36B|nr:sugar phosphate nucleotidyltransferase [Halorubrum amylolyticum]